MIQGQRSDTRLEARGGDLAGFMEVKTLAPRAVTTTRQLATLVESGAEGGTRWTRFAEVGDFVEMPSSVRGVVVV